MRTMQRAQQLQVMEEVEGYYKLDTLIESSPAVKSERPNRLIGVSQVLRHPKKCLQVLYDCWRRSNQGSQSVNAAER